MLRVESNRLNGKNSNDESGRISRAVNTAARRGERALKLECARCVFNVRKVGVFASSSSSSGDDDDVDKERKEEGEEEKDNSNSSGNSVSDDSDDERSKSEGDDVLVKISLSLIDFYRNELSPFMPKSCRFIPSCSNYAFEAYTKYGAGKGFILTAWRIARCNPFGGRGYDPPRWPPSFMREDDAGEAK